MAEQNDIINEQNTDLKNGGNSETTRPRKPFVEPTISAPVDVLEATTFFQAATSGQSAPPP